jgi:hypothetical protein
MENSNPVVHKVVRQEDVDLPIAWNRRQVRSERWQRKEKVDDDSQDPCWGGREPITPREVFELIRNINDPEHPLTLEQLNVVSVGDINA